MCNLLFLTTCGEVWTFLRLNLIPELKSLEDNFLILTGDNLDLWRGISLSPGKLRSVIIFLFLIIAGFPLTKTTSPTFISLSSKSWLMASLSKFLTMITLSLSWLTFLRLIILVLTLSLLSVFTTGTLRSCPSYNNFLDISM